MTNKWRPGMVDHFVAARFDWGCLECTTPNGPHHSGSMVFTPLNGKVINNSTVRRGA